MLAEVEPSSAILIPVAVHCAGRWLASDMKTSTTESPVQMVGLEEEVLPACYPIGPCCMDVMG